MWIKICGTTNLEDAELAIGLGADALGFIFAPSKRRVSAAQAAAITARLPEGVERVGVFLGQSAAEIAATVESAGLTAVQIHDAGAGGRLAGEVRTSLGEGVPIIQAVHYEVQEVVRAEPGVAGDRGEGRERESDGGQPGAVALREQIDRMAGSGAIDRVLVDSRVGAASGGTGVAFDWEGARGVLAGLPERMRLIVAGGLTAENVGEAIRVLRPWGVDAVSGVEASPGRKDAEKLAAFIERARA